MAQSELLGGGGGGREAKWLGYAGLPAGLEGLGLRPWPAGCGSIEKRFACQMLDKVSGIVPPRLTVLRACAEGSLPDVVGAVLAPGDGTGQQVPLSNWGGVGGVRASRN